MSVRKGLPVAESPAGPWIDRLAALAFVAAAAAVVWLLAGIQPDPTGHGTHQALGMAPCGWAQLGYPCPTCGVTTAATWLVHLHPIQAVWTQPFGAALAGFGLWLAALAGWSLVRRESFVERLARLPYGTLFAVGIVLLLAAWGFVWLTWKP